MNHITYAHYKPDGSMFYIGKGSISRAHSSAGRNVVWNRTVAKHGGFKVEILGRWATEKEAFDHEIFLIDTMRSLDVPLVNIAEGGFGSKGFRHTDQFKKNLSVRMRINNPMNDEEAKDRHAESLRKAMKRPEVKNKIRKSRIGMKFSTSHVESLQNCHPTRPCIINGVEYKSLMEASRTLGIRHGTLYRWLNNPNVAHNKKYRHIVECRWL